MNYSIISYIIGWIMMVEGAFMLLPSICGFIYGEQKPALAFLYVALASLLLGFLITRKKRMNQQFFAKEGFLIVALCWIVLSLIGAIPFVISGDIPDFTDALFETVSGLTTTGATILADVEALSHAALFWRALTHWMGGMGVLVFLLAILPMAGGYNMHLMRAESPGPSVGKLVPKVKDTAKILYLIYMAMTVIEFIALLIADMPFFDSLVTALATAGTGGFGIKADSIGGYNAAIQWIVGIFMILFGVNFNFYFFLLGKNKKNAFKMEEVRVYFLMILLSVAIISYNILDMVDNDFNKAVRDAFFQVASLVTSTGFATVDFNLWPTLSKTVLLLIMIVGACAGSTGGGIKVSRFIIALKAMSHEIVSFIHPRSVRSIELDGKPVDKATIHSVCVYFITFGMLYFSSVFVISFDQFDLVTNTTAVLATINNMGPGLEVVGPAGGFGGFTYLSKYIFIFDMLAGRLELYPILVMLSPATWKKH